MQRHPARQAFVEEAQDDEGGVDLANLPIDREYEIPSAGAGIAPERASALISQFDRKRRAAQLAVPTDDGKVRSTLRSMGEPITLFGEGPGDRRDRLRELMLQQVEADGEGGISTPADTPMNDIDEQPVDEEFYTEGTPELLAARQNIARYSIPRARARIEQQKKESTIPLRTQIKYRKAIKEKLSTFELYGTQIAGERPVSISRFSPNNEIIAAGNWSGGIKLLSVPDLEERVTLRGHTGIVGGIDWYPGSTLSTSNISPTSLNLASGAGGGGQPNEINLWSLESDTPLATLHGHTDRVARIAFHPTGQYLASASFDTTWRLWDVNHTPPGGQELLLQEGHSRPVYALSFSPDGSLLASGGFDSIGRIWDLRTGRTVMILEGHIREIYSLDWGIDGYRVLSGSGDGWVKCWDLRAVRNIGGLGAHKGNVSDLRWYKGPNTVSMPIANEVSMTDASPSANGSATFTTNGSSGSEGVVQPKAPGTFLVSSGFDKTVNVYSADDWSLIKQLSGHSGNVLSCDISSDARWIVSSGHDRSVKLWNRENIEDL